MAATPPLPPDPRLAGEWQLDAPPDDFPAEPEPVAPTAPAPPPSIPHPEIRTPQPPDPPPTPGQLVEAMLFVGGPPLTAAAACAAVRGLTADGFRAAVDGLNRRYRAQRRPYAVEARDDGFVLALLPAHRGVRERVFGGPREARLTPPMLDVLAVVAYRQPVGKAEVDAARGTDSGAVLRQLVRLGLVAVRQRADADGNEVRYGTTPRFLRVMNLGSLDDLPRLGDTQPA
ncbi:SMC-Scp complex subunit ScpB [bacterium]|nr:SMC-Scp complex subunit ScpB [bacterium]